MKKPSAVLCDIFIDGCKNSVASPSIELKQQQACSKVLRHVCNHHLLALWLVLPQGSIEEFSGCCICHLTIDGHEPCNQLDELLQGLAYQYPGTLFIRTRTSRASPLRGQLQMTSLPGGCLLAVHSGKWRRCAHTSAASSSMAGTAMAWKAALFMVDSPHSCAQGLSTKQLKVPWCCHVGSCRPDVLQGRCSRGEGSSDSFWAA
jgi:hypothetical protein